MHVIVLGAGEVGSYVAERLSKQGIDVAVVETDAETLRSVEERMDVLVVHGSGVNPSVLADAGVDRADLLVAVTNDDAVNLMASLVAKLAGVKSSLVRIESEELRSDATAELRKRVGADRFIDPDAEAARNIIELLELPGASEVEYLAEGEVMIVGARLSATSSLAGKTLHQVANEHEPNWEFLFGTISREGETVIPRGNYELRANDMVRVLGKRTYRREIMELLELPLRAPRRVLLLGGGRTAELVATPLVRRGSEVVIVERDSERARELAEKLHRVTVLKGDVTDAQVLADAEIGTFDAVAALTGEDDANIISCLFANNQGAGETLAIAHRLELLPLLNQIGIDASLSPRTATADRVIAMVRGEIAGVATTLEGSIEILEYEVASGSQADGAVVSEMHLPHDVLLGAVVRDNHAEIARGHSKLLQGDHVVVFAMPDRASQVGKLFRVSDRMVGDVRAEPTEELGGARVRRVSAEVKIAAVSILSCGLALLVSALVDLTDGATDSLGLAAVGAVAVGLGALGVANVEMPSRLSPRRSLRTVGVGLASMIVVSIIAYRVTGTITRPGEALMESTAGFTTTALTVIEDPEAQARGILFWRATTQWLGGFSALAAVIAVLPFLGVAASADPRTRLPTESPHLNSAHVRRVLARYFGLYVFLTVLGAVLFLIGGMGPFDAVTYAFTTISTGGFANHAGSFTFFDSALIEWMGVAGMFLGGLSLAIVWSVLRGRSRNVLGSRELWAYCALIAAATAVFAVVQSPGNTLFANIRLSAFTATSAVSSTGHWVANWAEWAPGPQWILVILIGLGAMSGSMGGGFRIARGMALFSYLWRELDSQLRPGVVKVVRVGTETIDEPRVRRILGYQVLFVGTAAAGFVALGMAGADEVTALSGSLSALATFGPALGDLGVTEPLSVMGRDALVVLLVLMFAGRVELYPLLDGVVATITWPLRRLRNASAKGRT